MNKKVVFTTKAPAAIGPYSQAITTGNLLFASGQIPVDPATGEVVAGGIEAQTKQVLANIRAVLAEAGAGMESVIKTTVFLTDLGDFQTVNAIYGEAFAQEPPARSCIQVSALPKGVAVEIEVVAVLS